MYPQLITPATIKSLTIPAPPTVTYRPVRSNRKASREVSGLAEGVSLPKHLTFLANKKNHIRLSPPALHDPKTMAHEASSPVGSEVQAYACSLLPLRTHADPPPLLAPSTYGEHCKTDIPAPRSLFTPVNVVLFSLFVYLVYTRLRPAPAPSVLAAPEPMVFKTFTPKTLRPFNGVDEPRVMLGVQGKVFDVSAGMSFYGPNGPYSNFAGRDASRGLAKNSFDEDMLTDIEKPLDTLEDLTDEEKGSLREWAALFEGKYLLVGRLVNEGEE